MQIEQLEQNGTRIAAGMAGTPLLSSSEDLSSLLEACFASGARSLLLHPENLPSRFFDLRSGEAGEILQRLRNYGFRLALLAKPAELPAGRFTEMSRDESQARDFAVFGDREQALAWLSEV